MSSRSNEEGARGIELGCEGRSVPSSSASCNTLRKSKKRGRALTRLPFAYLLGKLFRFHREGEQQRVGDFVHDFCSGVGFGVE